MITLHDRMLKDLLKNLSNEHGDSKDNAIILIFSVSLLVSEFAQAKYVTPELNSKSKYKKLAVIIRVLHNMQSSVISRCCFAEDGKEMCRDL